MAKKFLAQLKKIRKKSAFTKQRRLARAQNTDTSNAVIDRSNTDSKPTEASPEACDPDPVPPSESAKDPVPSSESVLDSRPPAEPVRDHALTSGCYISGVADAPLPVPPVPNPWVPDMRHKVSRATLRRNNYYLPR